MEHLILRMEDGEQVSGTKVTKDLIDESKRHRRNPTWFVDEEWGIAKYQKRDSDDPERDKGKQDSKDERESAQVSSDDALVASLREQIGELKEEKRQRIAEHEEDKRRFDKQLAMTKEMFDALKEEGIATKELLQSIVDRLPESPRQQTLGVPTPPVDVSIESKSKPVQKKKTTKKANSKRRKKKQKSIWHRDVAEFLPFRRR